MDFATKEKGPNSDARAQGDSRAALLAYLDTDTVRFLEIYSRFILTDVQQIR